MTFFEVAVWEFIGFTVGVLGLVTSLLYGVSGILLGQLSYGVGMIAYYLASLIGAVIFVVSEHLWEWSQSLTVEGI